MNNLTNNIVDNDKMFYIYSSELEGRLDPFYYQPSIRELENKVRKQSTKKLRNYISKISSGATPSVKEEEKYYSDKDNGIPFLRVQNLQPNGKINLEDVKYINQETHDKLLKRSQVAEHDLLVKITGVGRMAIASVAPDGFVGNTNQHMVVIKIEDKITSEYLSSYLNLDFVEKLASRRATGGTRPALDYPALKSIPIIENIDFSKIVEAEKQKAIKEKEAKELLDSIDDYLLGELGISIPERNNSLRARVFNVGFADISGDRWDPEYHYLHYSNLYNNILGSKYKTQILKHCIEHPIKGIEVGSKEYINEGIPFIRVADISNYGVDYSTEKRIKIELYNDLKEIYQPQAGDLLYTKDGTIGFCYLLKEVRPSILSSGILRLKSKIGIDKLYLQFVLSSKLYNTLANRESIGTVIKHLNIDNFMKIPVPLPKLEEQIKIASHIQNIRDKAKFIQEEANKILDQAKLDLQNSLLNQ